MLELNCSEFSEMPPRKQRPKATVISGQAFYGTEELTRENLEELRFSCLNEAVTGLVHDWNGRILGVICLNLAHDNSRIQSSSFSLVGKIFSNDSPKSYNSARFFLGTPMKFLCFELDLSIFRFPDSLTSDFVDYSSIKYQIKLTENSAPLSLEEEREKGIEGFCLRAFIHPTEDLWAKCTLSLYPLPLAKLLETYPLAVNEAFPGFTLWSNKFRLAPSQTDVIANLDWGCPLLPAIISSTEFDECADIPPTRDLRAAMFSLLRKVSLPDNKQNTKFLLDAWARCAAEGESAMKSPTLKVIWPAPRAPMSPLEGRKDPYFISIFSFS